MSGSQFHRSAAVSESNIPIPKRLSTGIKKSKKCAQLPELQKYIETIIKASNECDSEDTSLSDKDRFPKERKFGRYSVYKGIENKMKDEKIKNDVNVNRCKSYIKPKAPVLEAVSRGVQINSNSLAPEFEDPRNWNVTKTQNLGPSVEIEKFLKQFYPNPYHLENVNEFKDSKVDEKDHLRDGTLPDVVISKANIHTEVGIDKTDNDLETADIEIKPCKRESESTISDPKLKKCVKSPSPSDSKKMDDPKSIRAPSLGKASNFLSNTSSQASSVESLSDTFRHKESQMNFKKRKCLKSKNRLKHVKSEEDYDIGKLKLLNLSDSDDSVPREISKIKDTINLVDEKSSTLSEEAYKAEELNDLKEIYDMMYRATESFFCISSRNEIKEDSIILTENNTVQLNNENKKPSDYDNDIRSSNSYNSGRETYPQVIDNSNDKSSIQIEKNFEKEEASLRGSSLLNVLLKEDKYEFKSSPEDTEAEQIQQRVQEPVRDQASSLPNPDEGNLKAKESKKEEQSNSSDNQEKDEVLEYMYDCLKKFTNKKKPEEESNALPEDKKTLKKTVSCRIFGKQSVTEINVQKPTITSEATDFTSTYQKHSIESLLQKNFPDIKNIQCKYTAALNEINKRPGNKIRCHRRSLHAFTRDMPLTRNKRNEMPSLISSVATASSTNMQPETVQYSTADPNENAAVFTPVTVESQNELGGCAEETDEAQISGDMRIPKPVLPLSVSRRERSKVNTWKKLKDVLEAEEKLLSVEFEGEDSKSENESLKGLGFNEAQSLVSCNEADENVDSVKSYSHFNDFKRSSSNFVICENSLFESMKNVTSISPNVPVPFSASLGDLKKDSRSTTFCPKLPLKKIPPPVIRECYVLMYNYVIQQAISRVWQKTNILYIAQSVCMKLTTNVSNSTEEAPLKSSECLVHIIVKPVEQSLTVKSENALISPPESTVDREEDKPVEALIEAIEETEEKVCLLEKRTESSQSLYSRNSEMFRPRERLKYELSENDVERMNDKKKIHELLLRTYNLQEKLQQYLERITSTKPTSVSCPLMQRNLVDTSLKNKNKINFEVRPNCSLPVVHWHLETVVTDTKSKMDESVAVSVTMVDHGTTYDPPAVEEICEKAKESDHEAKDLPNYEKGDGFSENMKNDEDDRSSTYSFKSSNDFSVTSEDENRNKDVIESDHTNTKFYKKIFNEIESFRQSFEAEKIERRQHEEANPKETTELLDRQLTQYDPKIPAKVLKTVFKGKKSMTELTIGLKDVPMTKVGNISVEKTKFSSNHTKISISISKEHSEPTHKKVSSSYYFNDMRPSLSSCLTEYSRLKDTDSKTSESLNEDSDDDEEDYKSVGSSIDNSDSEENEKEKTEPKKDKTPEVPPTKSFTKHRFDFYRKMSTDLDTSRSKLKSQTNSVCRYKELEPLKQALTEMQIRMRNIKREALYDSNDYFERALKLAKMSAGFCQSCGNRAVIPNDTFGYYRTLLPRRYSHHRRNRHFRPNITPNPSIYSLRSSSADINDHFYDLGIKQGSYMLNPTIHTSRTVLRTSLHDMPILFEGCNLQKLG